MSSHRLARRLVLLGVVAVLAAALLPATAFASGSWNLATDFIARGDASGPWAKDTNGDTIWYFKDASSATNPGTFTSSNLQWTTTYSWMPPATPGLKGWIRTGVGLPHVSVNTGADAISSTSPPFTWRSGKVLAHPMPVTDAYPYPVIEWKAPGAGDVDVSLTLTDVDSGGGDGFEYWVLHDSDVLATATVANGGVGTQSLADVGVASGDSIYVVIGPRGAGSTGHYYDSTQIDLDVSLTSPVVSTPAASAWSLALVAVLGAAIAFRFRRREAA